MRSPLGVTMITDADQSAKLLGHVAWDGSTATSERALLRAAVVNRRLVERNQYVRIQDAEGVRSGSLARVLPGPFFHRTGPRPSAGCRPGCPWRSSSSPTWRSRANSSTAGPATRT